MQRSRKVKEVLEQRGRRAEEIWSAREHVRYLGCFKGGWAGGQVLPDRNLRSVLVFHVISAIDDTTLVFAFPRNVEILFDTDFH